MDFAARQIVEMKKTAERLSLKRLRETRFTLRSEKIPIPSDPVRDIVGASGTSPFETASARRRSKASTFHDYLHLRTTGQPKGAVHVHAGSS